MGDRKNHLIGMILVLIGASSYGLLSPLTKLAYEDGFGASQISASQLTYGAVLMWILVACRPGRWMNPFRGPWIKLSLTGLIGISSTTVLLNMALTTMNASLVIVMLFQFTWITLLMELIADRRRPTGRELVSVILVLAGTVLTVNVFQPEAAAGVNAAGIVYSLLAALTYSSFIILTGRIRTSMDPMLKAAVMLTSSVPLIVILYPVSQLVDSDSAALIGWGLVLGMLGQVIPTTTFNWGIPKIGGALAGVLGSVELPVAVIGALFIVQEQVALQQWLGIGFILVGIVVAQLQANRPSKRDVAGG